MITPRKDHTKLICDITEISGLFNDTPSLDAFLERIVVMISEHLQTEVCSIYLFYENSQELVLKATKGLNPQSVGKVRMLLGEGLTGLSLKELRPICERNASRNPNFKPFPGIGEEKYESFIAVPIVRGHTRIGVMVIQNLKRDFFQDDDIKALRAITSQLANTIETTRLLMMLQDEHKKGVETPRGETLKFLKGRVGSEGYAYGETFVMDLDTELMDPQIGKKHKEYSIEDFYRAVKLSEEQLEKLQKEVEVQLSDVASLIFAAQILMLKDKAFLDEIVTRIGQREDVFSAVHHVVRKYVDLFNKIPNVYLREKSHDIKDIGKRILKNLLGVFEKTYDFEEKIVIAKELFPSDILKLSSQHVKGIILLSGGTSSHLAILARSLLIPLVIAEDVRLLGLGPSSKIILDAEQGNIFINPTKEILKPFEERERARNALAASTAISSKCQTTDGTPIALMANINLLSDLKIACALQCDGIGLYRTEFPFIVRSDFPSEEEQYVIYKKLVDGMEGKEIIFRTLDIGGDKVLSYYAFEKEENPFLGMRSIRFSLGHVDIFTQQIRAILRAGAHAKVKMMFPMISSIDEYLSAKQIVEQCANELKKEGAVFNEHIPLGVMIELPSVLEIIEELAKEADFFSVGTNDFIQYMLAVDRTNEKVADFYLAHHPAVLRGLKRVTETAIRYGKDISVCGDMAHDPRYIPFFLGIGIKKLSLNPRDLAKIRPLICSLNLQDCKTISQKLLCLSTIGEISKVIGSIK